MNQMKEIDNEPINIDQILDEENALLFFHASRCSSCKPLLVWIDELEEKHGKRVRIARIDTTNNKDLVRKFEIFAIPTIIFIKKGVTITKTIGVLDKKTFQQKIHNAFDIR